MSTDRDRIEALRLITLQELLTIVPYTATHIYRLEAQGLFPRRVRVGPARVAWRLAEIIEWLEALPVVELPSPSSTDGAQGSVEQTDLFPLR